MKNIVYQFQSLPTPKQQSFTIFPYFSLCHSNLSKGLQGKKKKKKYKVEKFGCFHVIVFSLSSTSVRHHCNISFLKLEPKV